MMNLPMINVGIIGMGRSGRHLHAAKLNTMGDKFRIAAVADRQQARREHAIKTYHCHAYENYQDMIAQEALDLAIVATPSDLHLPTVLNLLAGGVHVLCEKPLAKSSTEVDQMIKAAEKSGKLLAVFHNSRFKPAYLQLKSVIESGILGRIVQIKMTDNSFTRRWDWQTMQRYNGGSLMNSGSHILDQTLQLLAADFDPRITCFMDRTNTFGDAEDYVKLMMRDKDGPVVDIEISSSAPYSGMTYQIQGLYGGLQGNEEWLEWKYVMPEELPQQTLTTEPLIDKSGNPAFCAESLQWYEQRWERSQHAEYDDMWGYMTEALYQKLHRSLAAGESFEITPQQVRLQMSIMEQCRLQNPQIYQSEFEK